MYQVQSFELYKSSPKWIDLLLITELSPLLIFKLQMPLRQTQIAEYHIKALCTLVKYNFSYLYQYQYYNFIYMPHKNNLPFSHDYFC